MSMYIPLDVHTLGFDMAYPAELQGLCDVALTLTRSTEMLWRLSTSKLCVSALRMPTYGDPLFESLISL